MWVAHAPHRTARGRRERHNPGIAGRVRTWGAHALRRDRPGAEGHATDTGVPAHDAGGAHAPRPDARGTGRASRTGLLRAPARAARMPRAQTPVTLGTRVARSCRTHRHVRRACPAPRRPWLWGREARGAAARTGTWGAHALRRDGP
jgi:hypothetical protein